ncbi:MAG: hypothetical protein H6779_01560 [Candidatus Nomurabacteria bacterium]|nr:hypothetical protein [Candidatus Nomurabacteria bacterium]USN88115.1 MAG: hypothetical protein H6779_01560 [Candidatus Nomurabacteria bacterium]
MDVVTIDGIEYHRASLLAKKFKYTSDYIGQLCRARKIDAQLIGRNWYVNPISLSAHKKNRYVESKSTSEKTLINSGMSLKSRIDVQPALTKNVAKNRILNKNFERKITWKPIQYEVDDADLMPRLQGESKKLSVNLAESKKLNLPGASKGVEFTSSELPEISLKGEISVTSIQDDFTEYDLVKEDDLNNSKTNKVNLELKKFIETDTVSLNVTPSSLPIASTPERDFFVPTTLWLLIAVFILLFLATALVEVEVVYTPNGVDFGYKL